MFTVLRVARIRYTRKGSLVVIDEEFEDDRRESGGRRASDTPTVPLRDHLETLIRGISLRHEQEVADLSRSLKEFLSECRASWDKHDEKLHKMKTEVAALRLLEEHRQGQQAAKKRIGEWAMWVPTVLSVAIAAYVAFN